VNDKEGNNHEKDPEHEHFFQGNRRPQAAPHGFLSRERPAQLERYTPSFEFLLEAGDESENATPYSGTAGPKQPISIG
jgi:hypothetical protein